jgi:hypothetical protein
LRLADWKLRWEKAAMEDIPAPKRSRLVSVLLWLIPAWLILSAGVGIWLYLRSEQKDADKENQKFVTAVSEKTLNQDLSKVQSLIGPRHPKVKSGQGLTRAASWIEGGLGPSNTGYKVERLVRSSPWPLLYVSLRSSESSHSPLWVIVSYDTPTEGSHGLDAALVAQLAAAQAFAGEKPLRTVFFAFLPPLPDGDDFSASVGADLVAEILKSGPSPMVLTLGEMAPGSMLYASPDTTNARILAAINAVDGTIGSESPNQDSLTSALKSAGLSPIHLTAIHARQPVTHELAVITGRLLELIREIALKK